MFTRHVPQTIATLPARLIDNGLVLQILEPMWKATPRLASDLRGFIEQILDWAVARGFRAEGLNPARWEGHLAHQLPSARKVRPTVHYPALPYMEVPACLTALHRIPETVARATEFIILTAVRVGDVLGAKPMLWSHVDLAAKTWDIPENEKRSAASGSTISARHCHTGAGQAAS